MRPGADERIALTSSSVPTGLATGADWQPALSPSVVGEVSGEVSSVPATQITQDRDGVVCSAMRAIQVYEYGPADSMRLEDVAVPRPQPGQVLIKVAAAGVNPVDWKRRSGAYHSIMPLTFPWIPGVDVSGTVAALGDGVQGFEIGQKVFGIGKGSYAEYCVAKAADLASVPDGTSFEEAATLALGGLTAWGALKDLELKPGQKILIHGAAGGVGYFAVQIAKDMGADIAATASAANLDFVRALGANRVIDYAASRFENEVSGLDAVLDTVGGDTLTRSYGVVKKGGIVATTAGSPDEAKAAERGITCKRVAQAPGSELTRIAGFVRQGALKPMIGSVYTLAEAARAHTESESRHGRGRIVIKVS